MTTVSYPHIAVSPSGKPYVQDTGVGVKTIALAHLREGLSAEEIAVTYGPLTLGQVYAALAYYYDHIEAMDQRIADGERLAQEMQDNLDSSPRLRARLRSGELNAMLDAHPDLREQLRRRGLLV